ncbi:MAG: molybdopterin dinucleotide binding domain-containing protein [Candidatus Bathyarchaeia archaeon]
MNRLRVTLLTGRTIYQGVGKEFGKLSEEYWKRVATCEMDPSDMESLGVEEGNNVRVTTDFGSVVVKAVESMRSPHPGVIFIPYGPWANLVTSSRTHSVGMPSFKGIPAEVELSSEERVMRTAELLQRYYGERSKCQS